MHETSVGTKFSALTDISFFFRQYRAEHVTLNMTYNSSGSGAGKLQIKGKQSSNSAITYAGSDISLSAEEQKEFPDLKAFPVMAG